MTQPSLSDYERKTQTVVRVCAKGHPVILYYVRRDQPEPPCQACAAKAHD